MKINLNLIKKLIPQINTLNDRILLNAPGIESYGLGESDEPDHEIEQQISFSNDPAHLVTSLTKWGKQKPTIDIDLKCVLEPSSSPDKYHLFIDKSLTDEEYEKLLTTLVEVGICQPGILSHQYEKYGYTAVRLPGIKKPNSDGDSRVKPGSYEKDGKKDPF